ncbi:MAG: rpoC, partial [Ignavibacteriaceae bacterium]|nr:rpoC [Ignavibacteriaceae bacterium]
LKKYDVPYGAELLVNDGQKIKKRQPLYNHDPYNAVILSDIYGRVKFVDLVDGITLQQVTDDQTGHVQKVVIESKDKNLTPSMLVENEDGVKKSFNLPVRAYLSVEDGENILAGTILAKISKQTTKSRDITGGLPRVTELFEARSPHESAVVAEIEGFVKFGARKKGSREIMVVAPDKSDEKKYNVALQRHILVQEGDEIPAGEKITDGPVNPHDILAIKGTSAVQEYLVNEIQDVYRLQGVKINDKHIEVIVRQMLQKIKIVFPSTESFISAASFQETTKVLANAATEAKVDHLLGLKENVVMGHLIPAGTGIKKYRKIILESEEVESAEEKVDEKELLPND